MKKYYAVKVGYNPGIYNNWDDCLKEVKGYSGAIYKGFGTKEEAENFLYDKKSSEENLDNNTIVAYVDGSFDKDLNRYSYACIIIDNGKKETIFGSGEDPELISMRDVAGEIIASKEAMKCAIEKFKSKLLLYYDYEGIAKWCTGEWKAKNKNTKEYAAFYQSIKDKLKVEFIKVKSHSNNEYNDMADKLAKKALLN